MEIKEAYEQYFNTVYGYLCTLTGGNYNLAEELTQETFYRATKKISEFRGEAKMSTWLCQIAKFVYYQSLDMNIFKEIYKLSSPMRDVVMLRLTGELSFKEIGDIMAQSENWARVTFYRAKQMLGKELKRDE